MQAITTRPKIAQNRERGMNRRIARLSANPATNAKSWLLSHSVSEETNEPFSWKKANIGENNGSISDFSCFIGHTNYIKKSILGKIKISGKEKAITLEHHWRWFWRSCGSKQGKQNLKKNTGIETYDKHKINYLGSLFQRWKCLSSPHCSDWWKPVKTVYE